MLSFLVLDIFRQHSVWALGTWLVSFFIKPPSYHWACFSRGIYLQQIIPLNRWRAPSWSQYFLIKCSMSCRCQATNAIAVAPWGQSLSEKRKKKWKLNIFGGSDIPMSQCSETKRAKQQGAVLRDKHRKSLCWWKQTVSLPVVVNRGSLPMTNKILTPNQSNWRVILEMQEVWVGDCSCFTAANPLRAEIKAPLLHNKIRPRSQENQTSH